MTVDVLIAFPEEDSPAQLLGVYTDEEACRDTYVSLLDVAVPVEMHTVNLNPDFMSALSQWTGDPNTWIDLFSDNEA